MQADRASKQQVAETPARIALADAVKHMDWILEQYDQIEQQLTGLTWQTTLVLPSHPFGKAV